MYDFQKFKTKTIFAGNIFTCIMTLNYALEEQSLINLMNLLNKKIWIKTEKYWYLKTQIDLLKGNIEQKQ